MSSENPDYVPGLGELVADTGHDRIGVAWGWDGEKLTLREPAGPETWNTTEFRQATKGEELRARVAQANADSRWRRGCELHALAGRLSPDASECPRDSRNGEP
ncbi:hypothetical protein RKE29_10645 [Streptomyces sp. B1866]|uniref:hypothetical protein n=1 Tax=Streptomyces sp. B1866 TaxID=3075431 RepID=UPI00288DA24B|nr:hypothetical protein [Streptomyces sp. B1866]MDT3397099.1 hypothetical protein [Streptomyces sp. B1866]